MIPLSFKYIKKALLLATLLASKSIICFQANAEDSISIKGLTSEKKAQEIERKLANKKKFKSSKRKESSDRIIAPKSPYLGIMSSPHAIGVGIGQTFVNGDFHENGSSKITGEVFYNYTASHSFDFIANLHVSNHQYRKRTSRLSGVALGIKGKIYQFDAFSPYVMGGFGFYTPKVTRNVDGDKYETSSSSIVFGNHAGIGADLNLNYRVKIGVLLHYHNPFDVRQEYGPKVEGSYYKFLLTGFFSL